MPELQAPVVTQAREPVQTPAATKATRPSANPQSRSGPEPNLLAQVTSDSTLMGITGAVAVVLLSLTWVLVRRRRETEEQFQESVLLPTGEGSTMELSPGGSARKGGDVAEETSFISDFSPSDIDALQEETGEVDPAAEADVYIAYGRYQQAETLIKQAIEKAPERLDLKLKLGEIYVTTRNIAAFVGLAETMEAAKADSQDPSIWERVESMGRELIPTHRLFADADTTSAETGETGETDATASDQLGSDSEALADFDLKLGGESTAAGGEDSSLNVATQSG
jgi:pilus assembly protein FimV